VVEEGYKTNLTQYQRRIAFYHLTSASRKQSERQASGAVSRVPAKANDAYTTRQARPSGRGHWIIKL